MDKKYCKVEISDQTDPLELEIMSGNLGPDVIDISNLTKKILYLLMTLALSQLQAVKAI